MGARKCAEDCVLVERDVFLECVLADMIHDCFSLALVERGW